MTKKEIAKKINDAWKPKSAFKDSQLYKQMTDKKKK